MSVGHYGFSWSSATSGIYGLDLYFGSRYLSPSTSDSRANGRQLRCLSEETRNACDSKNRTGRSSSPFTTPILSGSGRALPGWAERPSAQARRPAVAISTAKFGLPPRGEAALRLGGKPGDSHESRYSLSASSSARKQARPSSSPRVRLNAAPLSLRHYRRPRQFLPDWPSANRQNMPS